MGTTAADAEDAAQDALLNAHRSLAQFRGRSSFATWMLAVVRNAVRDASKLRRVRAHQVEALALVTGDLELSSPDAEELLDRAQTRDSVWQAIDLLPPPYRRAVVMFELEGHSYEEIAASEAISIGTVKSRLSRGRAGLRRLLEAF
jgi:RNA polymerase sigma-70 factor (ECF subfamily)